MSKFYIMTQEADFIPAAWQGGWDGVSAIGNVNRIIDSNQTLFSGKGSATIANTAQPPTTRKMAIFRGVSRKLQPQTISGTLDMVLGVIESGLSNTAYTRVHVYVLNKTTGAVLGTLLNQYEETVAMSAVAWGNEIGKAFKTPQTLTPVTIPSDANDYRLIVEFGFNTTHPGGFIN